MEIVKVRIDQLKHAEYNPRKVTPEDFEQIKKSIKEFGLVQPIVCNRAAGREGVIIGGNQRYEVIKQMGYEEIDVLYVDIPDLAREKELNIRLNRAQADWDWEILQKEFTIEGLTDWGFDPKEINFNFELSDKEENQNIPEPPIDPRSKKGEIYLLGKHRLMCGDSLEAADVFLLMGGKKADMVFTDPPYGVSYSKKNEYLNSFDKGNRNQKDIENDDWDEEGIKIFWKKAFENIRDVLAPVNSYYIFGPQIQGMMMMMMMMMEAGLPYRHVLIWIKNNHVLGRCDYNYKHEPIFFGWTKTHKFYGAGEFQTSVWPVDKPHKSDLHPTMKPLELIENALLNSSLQNQICLDPFLGSGSTLIACEKTERICYGMEIDPSYCDVIIKRFYNFTGTSEDSIYANAVRVRPEEKNNAREGGVEMHPEPSGISE